MKLKPWMRNSLALGTLIVAVGSTVAWTQYGSPMLQDASVWVSNITIAPNTVITADMFKTNFRQIKVPRSQVAAEVAGSESDIVGKMASETIPANTQITRYALETDPLVPTDNQEVISIPTAWVFSLPDTVRRGDRVNIYLQPLPHHNAGSPSNTTQSDSSSSNVPTPTTPVLQNVVVEFVHNGSNQEVKDTSSNPGGSNLAGRMNGTSTPKEVELLLTPSQFTLLQTASQNNQFIFAYH